MNRKTLKKVEKALGIRLYDWQKDYIMLESDFVPDGRGNGKTLAFILRILLNFEVKLSQNSLTMREYPGFEYLMFPCDEERSKNYQFGWYRQKVLETDALLKSAGIETILENTKSKAIFDKNVFRAHFMGEPIRLYDCNRCGFLDLTEQEQQALADKCFRNHYCTFYRKRVVHRTSNLIHNERLYPCQECETDKYVHYTEREDEKQ